LIYGGLGAKIVGLDFKLDGRFPKHVANPIKKKNIRHLQGEVRKRKVDFGMAFDADMDRVVFVDERGRRIGSSVISALLIEKFLKGRRGGKIVYASVMSKLVPEIVRKLGGKALIEKVGHSFIKTRMRKEKAVFGCEHSTHYYYKDNYYADSGIISSLIVCEMFSDFQKGGGRFSEFVKRFEKYYKIDEVNFNVKDRKKTLEKFYSKFGRKAKRIRRVDGLTFEFKDWWFNVRPSNTEPLVRVNLEAKDREMAREKLKMVERVVG
jgi:phosphomannomutase